MRVYRCIKLQEVINKYKNENNKIFDNHSLNTHQYQKNKEYIHFFRYDEFARYYFYLGKDGNYDFPNDRYILYMTANIPKEILDKSLGYGFYKVNGEDVIIPEYAIPVEEFDSNYIVDITDQPMGLPKRKNEDEEYRAYLKLIQTMKQVNDDTTKMLHYLLHNDLDSLIGIQVDTRSEKEIEEDILSLLSDINISKCDDLEIEEIDFKIK